MISVLVGSASDTLPAATGCPLRRHIEKRLLYRTSFITIESFCWTGKGFPRRNGSLRLFDTEERVAEVRGQIRVEAVVVAIFSSLVKVVESSSSHFHRVSDLYELLTCVFNVDFICVVKRLINLIVKQYNYLHLVACLVF